MITILKVASNCNYNFFVEKKLRNNNNNKWRDAIILSRFYLYFSNLYKYMTHATMPHTICKFNKFYISIYMPIYI